jgi:DNA-binding NtrC family response regulator
MPRRDQPPSACGVRSGERVGLVLTDCPMPNEMEGQELIREIAAVAPQITVQLISRHSAPSAEQHSVLMLLTKKIRSLNLVMRSPKLWSVSALIS